MFILHGLEQLEKELDGQHAAVYHRQAEQITHFTEEALRGKKLSDGEDFWFKGAEDKDIQGWILKPNGWKAGEKKKWPVLLLIHGGRPLIGSHFRDM